MVADYSCKGQPCDVLSKYFSLSVSLEVAGVMVPNIPKQMIGNTFSFC